MRDSKSPIESVGLRWCTTKLDFSPANLFSLKFDRGYRAQGATRTGLIKPCHLDCYAL